MYILPLLYNVVYTLPLLYGVVYTLYLLYSVDQVVHYPLGHSCGNPVLN